MKKQTITDNAIDSDQICEAVRITHAFACTGPYAILIMLGIKRVENRSQLPEPRRGVVPSVA